MSNSLEAFLQNNDLSEDDIKNPDFYMAILDKDGYCPCVQERKSQTICPCANYRYNGKCICKFLYDKLSSR